MRTCRSTIITALTLCLLAGTATSTVAQDAAADPADAEWPKLTTDIAYGDADRARQVIHVLAPAPRPAPRPAVVLFHGGGLVMGTPLQDLPQAQGLAEHGYVTFMAGYRLFDQSTGEHPWPTQLEDAQQAVRWIRAHADEFDIDPARLCAMGHSSGGQLASLLGMTEALPASEVANSDVSSRVDCAITVSGPVDLLVPQGNWFMRRVLDEMLGGTMDDVPEVWQAASPAHNVDEATVPFLVIHGSLDIDAPLAGSLNLVDALSKAGVEYVFAELPANHMDAWSSEATHRLAEAFLAYQLHPDL